MHSIAWSKRRKRTRDANPTRQSPSYDSMTEEELVRSIVSKLGIKRTDREDPPCAPSSEESVDALFEEEFMEDIVDFRDESSSILVSKDVSTKERRVSCYLCRRPPRNLFVKSVYSNNSFLCDTCICTIKSESRPYECSNMLMHALYKKWEGNQKVLNSWISIMLEDT